LQEKTWDLKTVARIIKKHYPGAKVVFFGSRVRGDYLKESDYDIIVVSKRFEGKHFTKRASEVLKILWKENIIGDFEILCYTPEEFERKRKSISIVREALSYGKVFD